MYRNHKSFAIVIDFLNKKVYREDPAHKSWVLNVEHPYFMTIHLPFLVAPSRRILFFSFRLLIALSIAVLGNPNSVTILAIVIELSICIAFISNCSLSVKSSFVTSFLASFLASFEVRNTGWIHSVRGILRNALFEAPPSSFNVNRGRMFENKLSAAKRDHRTHLSTFHLDYPSIFKTGNLIEFFLLIF